jgi:D-aminopeptidase
MAHGGQHPRRHPHAVQANTARKRLRELGITIGRFPTGPLNAITDVAGVRVGHCTLIQNPTPEGSAGAQHGEVRTGVTAILPHHDQIFTRRLLGGAFILNGAGEMSGLIQVQEWGLLETPILLTNTLSVGAVSRATVKHMLQRYPGIGVQHDVVIPIVGECDDSFLNDIRGNHVKSRHVAAALSGAKAGPVQEGAVGAGTGMVAFDLKSGIGTASRRVEAAGEVFTIGVLVLSNVGRYEDLMVDGLPVGRMLGPLQDERARRRSLYGSIIAVVATDAPLSVHQLNRLCKRAALGIGRAGSYAAHGSGEIILGFSTANEIPRSETVDFYHLKVIADRLIDPLYQGCIEATEEAIINALCMAEPMTGLEGRHVPALPLDQLVELFTRHRPT